MMKNLIAITCFVVALVSCNKVEHKLEGKWQLKTVEANGVVQTVDTDRKSTRLNSSHSV